jgi:hypothetical protein
MKWKTHWHKISLPTRLHYKQGSWSQACKDSRSNRGYFHKATRIWCFFQDERYVGSYKKIKFKEDVRSKLDFDFSEK